MLTTAPGFWTFWAGTFLNKRCSRSAAVTAWCGSTSQWNPLTRSDAYPVRLIIQEGEHGLCRCSPFRKSRSALRWSKIRGVAQPGSAAALGAEGPRFKSSHPDQDNFSTVLWMLNLAAESSLLSGAYSLMVKVVDCDSTHSGSTPGKHP